MNSFLVPVYIKIGKLNDEKLLTGLFMIETGHIWFYYSSKRLQLVNQISGLASGDLSKTILEQINDKVAQTNKELKLIKNDFFEVKHIFNVEYFEYLKKYGQNHIMVGDIQTISQQPSKDLFGDFCAKLLHEKPLVEKVHKTSFHSQVKNQFKTAGVDNKADIGLKIHPNQLSGLNNDITVSLIAKNGCVLAAETIDFNTSSGSIGNTLNAFDVLIFSLNKYTEKEQLKKGKYHLLFNEPKAGTEQEKLFNIVYKNKKGIYQLGTSEKVEEIKNEILDKEYSKFSLSLPSS